MTLPCFGLGGVVDSGECRQDLEFGLNVSEKKEQSINLKELWVKLAEFGKEKEMEGNSENKEMKETDRQMERARERERERERENE